MRFKQPSPDITIAAARGNHIEIIMWARANLCDWVTPTFYSPVDSIESSRADSCYYDIDVCSEAARNGNLSILEYAYEQGCPMNWITFANAAGKAHIHVLKWCFEKKCQRSEKIYRNAVVSGNLECIEWVRNSGINSGTFSIKVAFDVGHLHVIKYLIDNSICSWNTTSNEFNNFTLLAASKGCIDSLNWSQSNDPILPLHKDCSNTAATNGYLDCLKWCIEKGCILDPNIINNVVENGQLVIFKYLINSGIEELNERLLTLAITFKQDKIIKWIESKGFAE
jgi:hypothetical protein